MDNKRLSKEELLRFGKDIFEQSKCLQNRYLSMDEATIIFYLYKENVDKYKHMLDYYDGLTLGYEIEEMEKYFCQNGNSIEFIYDVLIAPCELIMEKIGYQPELNMENSNEK